MKRWIISYRGISSALIMLFFLCVACSTGRNNSLTRAYHELTTRYNVYYNAEQAYQKILEEQSRSFIDQFDSLLLLYPHVIPVDKQLPGGPFDLVVEKTSKAIREHSITAKPRRDPTKRLTAEQREWLQQDEFNPFLHNAWMLLGKAHLQNGDLEEALAVFSHIIRRYRHDEAIMNEAAIWMLRCYTEQNRLYQAEQSAQMLLMINLPDHLQQLFAETYTGYLLKRGDYRAAIPWLKRLIRNEKERSRKKREQYLLGQLLQHTGEQEEAYRAFEAVKGLSTPFDLQLQATVSQLPLAPREKEKKIRRALAKMKPLANEEQLRRIELALDGRAPESIPDRAAMAEKQPAALEVNDSLLRISGLHDSLYQVVYHAFMEGDTAKVITTASHFIKRFPESAWLPQLRQMQSLTQSGKLPPGSPPGAAWESLSESSNVKRESSVQPFLAELQGPHLFLLAFERLHTDRNKLLFSTATFNFSRFRLRTFDLTFFPLGVREALAVSTFYSFDEACQYGEMLLSDSLFIASLPAGVIPIVISEENAGRLRRNGRLEDYLTFQESHLTSLPPRYLPAEVGRKNEKSSKKQHKKIVPLETDRTTEKQTDDASVEAPPLYKEQLTPDELRQKLEQNAREALKQSEEKGDTQKSREEQLKERERKREERIRQREKELKERARRREQLLREREKEREQKIDKR